MTSDTNILRELYRVGDGGISGAVLAERMKVSRAAVWARIEELRKAGFEIEASPHHGYRLLVAPDRLLGDDIRARLSPVKRIGWQVQVFRETSSTNELADRLGRDGVREGAVVFAEFQTKGRGRLGRSWFSPGEKGILMSVLLRPALRPMEATRLTVLGATAVARAIERCGSVRPEIKWPNDIMLDGRKVAGILTEMNAELDRVRYLVLGIGLNVNQVKGDFPPEIKDLSTSIRLQAGLKINRAALAAAIIEELDRDYALVVDGKFSRVREEWESKCSTIGQSVSVQVGDSVTRGIAEAIDDEGALLVRSSSNQLHRVMGGDVSLHGGGARVTTGGL